MVYNFDCDEDLIFVFTAVSRNSLVSGATLPWGAGSSLWWLLLLQSTGFMHTGFNSCSMWTQYLWHASLVILQHVGYSWTRNQTYVLCFGRQVLNHWTTREVQTLVNFCFKQNYRWGICWHAWKECSWFPFLVQSLFSQKPYPVSVLFLLFYVIPIIPKAFIISLHKCHILVV